MAFLDSSTATSSYSIVGRRVEIAGIPFIGLGDITGGGVTKEGQAYTRGTDGRILFLSDGIKTPQDFTTVTTLGTFITLKDLLEIEAAIRGLVGDDRWMDVPVTFSNQIASNNPLAEAYSETMTLSVMSWQSENPAGGDGSKVTIVWKQHSLPTV
jgi:hypothetical protein